MKRFMKASIVLMLIASLFLGNFAGTFVWATEQETAGEGAEAVSESNWTWDESTNTLTLNNANIQETKSLPDGATVIVNGDCIINGGEADAISCEGALYIKGEGKLTLTGSNGIKAAAVSIEGIDVDIKATSCGIQVYNKAGAAKAMLTNVDGSISGGYAGIYVNGECTETEAAVVIENCELDAISTATSWNNRARKAGITVYVSTAKKVESSITIKDSKVNATGFDAGLSINNYVGDADATNSASSYINITNSTVVANGTNGTWSGIFASVLGQHPDADSIITITDSSVYAVSPNTGILTSSQAGESKIILNNSILGASGKTALSMIEETSQTQIAELNNGSTYVQMTPDAVMKGEIANFDGKTIVATAGDGITYDAENNYFVIPQGSVVTETSTDGAEKEYTFQNQAGGVGGYNYAKEEIWGFDGGDQVKEIIITTPEELIDFAARTQPGGDLGNCEGWIVKLGADIDMKDYFWYHRNAAGEIVTDHRIPAFSGIFDGQGYTIKNMKYLDEYKEATEAVPLAFIIECSNAPVVLKNLNIDGITVDTVAPARFAGLVDHFTAWQYNGEKGLISGITVSNVTVDSEADLVFGGMMHKTFGLASTISDCHVKNFTVNAKGALSGDNSGRCGGFIATGGETTDFKDCTVENFVVNAESTGGYLGGFIGGSSVSGDFFNCDVNGFELNAVAKFSAVGGFAAYTAGSAWGSNSTWENCDVAGLNIKTEDKIGVGAGGFIGNIYGQDTHKFINCTTEGSISGDAYAGGFAGWLYGRANCAVEFTNCAAAVNILDNDYYGGGFVGNFTPNGNNKITVTYSNCTASGDVFAAEPVGSFLDTDNNTIDGIIGGTYNYDPENVDTATGETNNVAPGYRALDNGDGTWTVFPDLGREVVKIHFHRWNDETDSYENWRTVEVFKDTCFLNPEHNNELNYSHPVYRFKDGDLDGIADGLEELNKDAGSAERPFTYWTDAADGLGEEILTNTTVITGDMNVYVAISPMDLTVNVSWIDNNNQDGVRPENITIRLWADGVEVDSVVVTEEMGWSYTFENLNKFANGEEIVYTITEDEVPGYTTEINGFDVTNTHEPEQTQVSVEKVWDDDDDFEGARPENITIRLWADGVEIESAVVTEEMGWSYTFEKLPVNMDGQKIVYTVTEDAVEGYEMIELSGDAENGFKIVNQYLIVVDDPEPPTTGDPIALVFALAAISLMGLAICVIKNRKTIA